MSASDREEVYRSTNRGLRATIQNQLASHRNISQRAIDLVKIDLLGASIAISVVSLSNVPVVIPFLAASVVAFLYSIWTSVRVFRPRHVSRGLGVSETWRIREIAENGVPPDAHHEQLTVTYREAVLHNSTAFVREAQLFGRAVWSSVAAVLFAAVAAAVIHVPVPGFVTPFVYVSVPAVCTWGKERYGYEHDSIS